MLGISCNTQRSYFYVLSEAPSLYCYDFSRQVKLQRQQGKRIQQTGHYPLKSWNLFYPRQDLSEFPPPFIIFGCCQSKIQGLRLNSISISNTKVSHSLFLMVLHNEFDVLPTSQEEKTARRGLYAPCGPQSGQENHRVTKILWNTQMEDTL